MCAERTVRVCLRADRAGALGRGARCGWCAATALVILKCIVYCVSYLFCMLYECNKIFKYKSSKHKTIETLVQSRWSGAVDSSPALEPLIRRRLRAVGTEPAPELLVRIRLWSCWCRSGSGAVGAIGALQNTHPYSAVTL